jgi:hypothetical protein
VLNKVLGKDFGKKPAIGRVVGAGYGDRWDYYYNERKDVRKERKRNAHASIEDKKTRLLVQDELTTQFQAMLLTMVESFRHWYCGGQKGPFRIQLQRQQLEQRGAA